MSCNFSTAIVSQKVHVITMLKELSIRPSRSGDMRKFLGKFQLKLTKVEEFSYLKTEK